MSHAFCSIIAKNYLPQANVLINSLRRHNPDAVFFLLIVDATINNHYDDDFVKILSPHDLSLNQDSLSKMHLIYDVVEFSTSMKPSLLKHILGLGFNTATFLDPDIQVFGPLNYAIEKAQENHIVVTPHRLTPTQNYRDEIIFLKYGVFNLGFICVSKESLQFLEWWESRLETGATRFEFSDIFTDQKWVNLLPAYFNYHVLRHPGYNVAPWNLDERDFSATGQNFWVGNEPLIFIHFSQMSGLLVRGGLNQDWLEKLSSIKMQTSNLTFFLSRVSDYVANLQDSSRFMIHSEDLSSESQVFSSKRPSYRAKLILGIESGASMSLNGNLGKRNLLDTITIELSRFHTFQLLNQSLRADWSKFIKKCRTLFSRSRSR